MVPLESQNAINITFAMEGQAFNFYLAVELCSSIVLWCLLSGL